MQSRHVAPQSLLADLAFAMFCSTCAVFALAGALGVLRWHELDGPSQVDAHCSITNCIHSRDGRHLLLTYWKPDADSEGIQHGLATLDLRPGSSALRATAGVIEPRVLAPIAGNTAYIVDAKGGVAMRRIDNAR